MCGLALVYNSFDGVKRLQPQLFIGITSPNTNVSYNTWEQRNPLSSELHICTWEYWIWF